MLDVVSDQAVMRDVYIAILSLRNSVHLIQPRIADWVVAKLSFCQDKGHFWVENRRRLRVALGLDAET
eukprot:8569549-Lingulodinium_polyedra.AAC.1